MYDHALANATPDVERRLNAVIFEYVERAVSLQRQGNEWAARDYLASVGVAPHIILRVLSCPAFRRKKHH